MKREKERNAKNASAGSSRPPQSSVTQKSRGAAQVQPSSQPHAPVSTSSTTSAVTTPSAATTSTTLKSTYVSWLRGIFSLLLFTLSIIIRSRI
ncbi:hypothetical protein K503DRAFT_145405 [Rhizopogon vinicolor AM-OR11-026]|uniref:Uncharacterized protein n=1 Tax=Rhizopogon vinicolor AM-OR11-026 TaxID=1314800 RepID=A0A1B7N1C8_9AGAM|nr:hypothetical protein K503DRAFT_145405 [Rhizopogon vinicolor AM-OR11-026]